MMKLAASDSQSRYIDKPCYVCGKDFIKWNNVQVHVHRKTGEIRYTHNDCHDRFMNERNWDMIQEYQQTDDPKLYS